MQRISRISLMLSAFCVTQVALRQAAAQSDINFAAPNVLLLVDTSGSMEYMTSSTAQPACDPNSAANSQKSRWVNLVEVLTGSINDYRCAAVDRASSAFVTEYSLGSNRPADYGYAIPYHRPISGNCIAAPGTINLTSNAYAVSDSSGGSRVSYHEYNNAANTCTFSQNASDGLLSTYASKVRFGLMTFDTKINKGTGQSGKTADFATGTAGTWSYFLNNPAQGMPGGCTALLDEEVGARNAAAPPWEGRMVAFGDPSPNSNNVDDNPTTRAQWIREILLTTRPFDATPVAGMLDDARAFLWNDKSKDPLDSTGVKDFGPYNDPYVLGGCRKNFVVLLTDGEPNLELRPPCEQAGGVCPYQHSYEISRDLYSQVGPKQVQTFVIGFAVSQVTVGGVTKDCRTLTSTEVDLTNPTSFCSQNQSNAALRACCVLDQIAYNGGTDHAYFADNTTELRSALSAILSKVSSGTTSRTWPVMSGAAGNTTANGDAAGYRFYTSFKPRLDLVNAGLWSGVVERQRFVCQTPTGGGSPVATLKDADIAAGDEFAANVNSGNGINNRKFYTVVGDVTGTKILSTGIIRPNLTTNDGSTAALYSGIQVNDNLDNFPSKVAAAALSITASTCATDIPSLNADDCRISRLKWLLGGDNGTKYLRCAQTGSTNCSLVADVYHSTPVVVNRPTDAPRDQTYQAFAAAWKQRPLMLYTSTNDGLLHAFKVATNYTVPSDDTLRVDALANNELWAFLPPAVLPGVVSEYPGTHLELLDGAPIVANIVAAPIASSTYEDGSPKYSFERTAAAFSDATSGTNVNATTWRTVLVQSFGKHRGGYFALDITNPDLNPSGPYWSLKPGPRFLWQLTEDTANRWLFGPSGVTPLITTLFFEPTNGAGAREIAVAVLPGGNADPDATGDVSRGDPTPSAMQNSGYTARTSIAKYGAIDALAARSLTIVRLDTGEIVRTFRRSKTEGNIPTAIQNRVIESPLDSPITGQPVAYPALVGAIADRVFVGDRDGALWRVNLSATDPSKWSMNLFFDAYAGHGAREGQPITTPPQLSIDDHGSVTIAFSTGSQDDFSANGSMLNYVWSLTENVNWAAQSFDASVNWYRLYRNGERAVGPLQLFGSGLYYVTYMPADASAACSSGSSTLWGMNYLTPDMNAPLSDTGSASRGGTAWLPKDGDPNNPARVQFLDNASALLAGATVFGVSVAQTPSCVDNSTATDSFFGSGVVHTTLPNITPASYQLVMQTGGAGAPRNGLSTNVTTMNLPPPDNSPRIASWAAIME